MSDSYPHVPASKTDLAKRKTIYGHGVNDAPYATCLRIEGVKNECPYYTKWRSMLMRVFSERYQTKHPTYVGCGVCEEWRSFMEFRSWMARQDWRGKELDKDLLLPGNKLYSPETCIFVEVKINRLLRDSERRRGAWPLGVHYRKSRRAFIAKVRDACGKEKVLGQFASPEEAHEAWRVAKIRVLTEVLCGQDDLRIKNGLLLHIGGLSV